MSVNEFTTTTAGEHVTVLIVVSSIGVARGVQGVQVHPPRAKKKIFLGIFCEMGQKWAAFGEVTPADEIKR